MKKTVLITGSSGFIGRNFIAEYSTQFNLVPVSLREVEPENIDFAGVDAVLHLAALVQQMKKSEPDQYFKINTELTDRLANAAKSAGVKHFVFFSTVKVYGTDGWFDMPDKELSIHSECSPNEPYGASKLAAELILNKLKDNNFKVAIVRPPLVYGADAKGNLKSLEKLIKFCPILPLKYSKNKRSLVSIENLLAQIEIILSNTFDGTIIPQDSEHVSLEQIMRSIAKANKSSVLLFRPPAILIWLLRIVAPNFAKRMFGNLWFKKDEDLRLEF